MEKFYKVEVTETRAIKIIANADKLVKEEGTEGYALMWLNLTNNQRVNSQKLLKIYNDYYNGIYVVVDPDKDNVKDAEDYLRRLGLEVERKEECVVVQPNEVFNDDDLDVELIEW